MKYIKLYENRHDFVFDEQRYFPNTALVNGEEEPTYFTDVEEVVFELTVTLPTEKVVTGQTYTLAVEYGGADVFASSTISTTGDVTLNGTQFTANTDGDFSVTATYDGKTVTLNGTSKLMTAAPTIEIGGGNTQYGRFTINVIGQGTKTMTFNGEEYTSNEVIFSKIYYEDLTEQTVVATATAQENGKWESDTVTKTFVVPVAAPLTATISDDTLEDGQTAQITVMYGSYDVTNIPYERTRYTASGDVTCTEEGVVTAAYSTGSGSIVVNYNNLPPITINVTVTEAVPVSPNIVFADPDVKAIVANAFGSNGEITEEQAAAVTTWFEGGYNNTSTNPFCKNANVDSFDEFAYFTGVTEIGEDAFQACSNMTSITLPSSLTVIPDYTFSGCSSLESVTIPAAVTYIGYRAFNGCSSLESITIGAGVSSMSTGVFDGCRNLAYMSVDTNNSSFNDGNGSNVIIDGSGNLLYGGGACSVIPNTVNSIGDRAFYNRSFVNDTLTIPASVTSIGNYAFYKSNSVPSSLKVVVMEATTPPTFGTNNDAFYYISNIFVPAASVDAYKAASGWSNYASKINGIANIVFADNDVKSILATQYGSNGEITNLQAATVTTFLSGNSSINPFYNNTNVDSFDELSYFTNITEIGTTFRGCSNMASVIIPAKVTSLGNYAFAGCSSLTSINIPLSLTSIGSYTFSDCSGLTGITIHSGVTSIGNSAFSGCSDMTYATIAGENTSIGDYAFNGCSSLTDITIPANATSIGSYTFSGCTSFTTVTIPSYVASIGNSAFSGCSNLTEITCEATTPPTLGSDAFYDTDDCPIYVPAASVDAYKAATNWSNYADRIQAIGGGEPVSPNIVFADPDVKAIVANAYGSNGEITEAQAAAVITFMSGTDSSNGFYGNTNINSFDEFRYFTSVSEIGDNTFENCSNMTSIIIPSSVTSIGNRAVRGCRSLTRVICEATVPPTLGNGVFGTTNGCPLYVPEESLDGYKTAPNWSTYASRIQAIGVTVSLPTENIVTGYKYNLNVTYNGGDVLSNATITSTGDVTISGSSFTANSDGAFSITATYNGYTATLNGTAYTPQYAVAVLDCSRLEDANPLKECFNGYYDEELEEDVVYQEPRIDCTFSGNVAVESGVITMSDDSTFDWFSVDASADSIGYIKLTHPSADYKVDTRYVDFNGGMYDYEAVTVTFDSATLTTTISNFVPYEGFDDTFDGSDFNMKFNSYGNNPIKITRIEVGYATPSE